MNENDVKYLCGPDGEVDEQDAAEAAADASEGEGADEEASEEGVEDSLDVLDDMEVPATQSEK